MSMETLAALSWLILAISLLLGDLAPLAFSRGRNAGVFRLGSDRSDDYTVLVPIYGHLSYLRNLDFLIGCSGRVILCTTTSETKEFDEEIDRLAVAHHFQISRVDVARGTSASVKRATSAPIRDVLIRDSLGIVMTTFVVCVDADTRPEVDLALAVGTVELNGIDVASVALAPSNAKSLLAAWQVHEYRLAMRMRRVYPWLVSGACHITRRSAHQDLMQQHSMFFQGNDVELGLLAGSNGYVTGHLIAPIATDVPESLRPWWRQRFAWAGGEFRLYFVNIQCARDHPGFYLYGVLVVSLLLPLRWYSLVDPSLYTFLSVGVYFVVIWGLNWSHRDRSLLTLPLYLASSSLVLVLLGPLSYLRMSFEHKNFGVIRGVRTEVLELADLADHGRA